MRLVSRTAHCVDGRDVALFDKALAVRREYHRERALQAPTDELAAAPAERKRASDEDGGTMDQREG